MNELNEQTWGIRINKKDFGKFDLETPNWVKDCENNRAWYSEGIVVWDETQKNVVNLSMWAAMDLLDRLRNNNDWKTQGKDVTQQFIKFSMEITRKRRKKAGDIQESEKPSSQSETVTIQLHLSPEHTEKLLKFLSNHEPYIRSTGEMQKGNHENAIGMLVDLIFKEKISKEDKLDS